MFKMKLTSLGVIETANGSFTNQAGTFSFEADQLTKVIPMMMRRRLKGAGRNAVALGCLALNFADDVDLVVFASRTGETIRCLHMLKEVLMGQALSPADFSGSVHNATAGVLAIVRKFKGETTAVAAGKHTFRAGIDETYAAFACENAKRVLLICFEDNLLGQDIMDFAGQEEFGQAFAVAMLWEATPGGNGAQALSLQEAMDNKEAYTALGLQENSALSSKFKLPQEVSWSGASADDAQTAIEVVHQLLAGQTILGTP